MMRSVSKKNIILITLYIIVFLNSFGYFLIFPVLVNLITDPVHSLIPNTLNQHLGDYLFSVVLGFGSVASLLFGPFIGRLSDQIGRRKVLISCTVLTLISFIFPILAIAQANIMLLILGNTINGIASNNQPVAQAAISDLSSKQQKKALRFSIDTCVITAAMTLGPVAGQYLSDPHIVSGFNASTPFWAAGILTLLSLILLCLCLPETNPHLDHGPKVVRHTLLALFDIIKAPVSILRLLLVFFLAQCAWAQYYQYSYLYLTETLHFTSQNLALYTAFIGVCMSFGLIVIYPLWLKIRPNALRSMTSQCLFVATLFLGLLARFPIPWVQWVAIMPLCLGMGMYFPSLLTLFSEYSSITSQGWIMAVSSASLGLAWLITGFSAIALSHISAQMPLYIATLLLGLAFLIMAHDNYRARYAG